MNDLFVNYAKHIAALPEHTPLRREDVLREECLLRREGELALYWAPFEHVESAARVVLVGITPGWFQTELAFRTARNALRNGMSHAEAGALARRTASFSGPIRRTLVGMLDDLALNRALGIETCHSLWHEHHAMLHTTALVRYPLFVNGQNYTGYKPGPLKSPLLRPFITEVLAGELRRTPQSLVVPLGRVVAQALRLLADEGAIERARLLPGLPHPSGANVHRRSQFEAIREEAVQAVATWFGKQGVGV